MTATSTYLVITFRVESERLAADIARALREHPSYLCHEIAQDEKPPVPVVHSGRSSQ